MDEKGGLQMATLLEQRYRVDAPLARGGMSAVYRGMDTRLDRPVAIKVMDRRFAEDRSFVDRFEREARAAASLHHPNVIAVHDQGFDGDHVFLVMELVDGGTLRDLLTERGRLPVPLALSVLEPVLSALAAAHRAGLVHRDVKPENVLIGKQGTVKVGDFGLVKAMAAAGSTSNDVILGTVAYLSPEQVTTGAATARGDVYSAGVLLYEMLTGTPPYVGDTPISVAYRHVNDDIPPPSMLAPGIPHALDELVLRATRRDPAVRPPDAGAFLAELERVRRAIGAPSVPIPAPSHGERTMPRAEEFPTVQTPNVQSPGVQTVAVQVPAGQAYGSVPGPSGTKAMLRSELDGVARPLITRDPPPLRPATGPQPVHSQPIPAQSFPKPKQQPGAKPGRPSPLAWLKRVPRWAIIAALIAVIAGVGTYLLTAEEPVPIPNVVGATEDTAKQKILAANLQPSVQRVRNDDVAKDKVISTDPVNGTMNPGSTVLVFVSSGPPVVPALDPGATLAAAQQALTGQDLKPQLDASQDQFDNAVPKGQVLRFSPSSGTQLKTGDAVVVVLSKGVAPLKPIPDVAGKTADEAQTLLREAGYSNIVVNQGFNPNVENGRVINSDPGAGNTPTDKRVTITVSTSVTVPNLQGKRVGEAREQLEKLGLRLNVRVGDDGERRRIFGQAPQPGTRVQKGSEVQVGTGFF